MCYKSSKHEVCLNNNVNNDIIFFNQKGTTRIDISPTQSNIKYRKCFRGNGDRRKEARDTSRENTMQSKLTNYEQNQVIAGAELPVQSTDATE